MQPNPYIVLEKVEEGLYKSIFVSNLAEAYRKCLESSDRTIVKKIDVKVIEQHGK